MPITYWTFLVGALALIGFPGFVGLLFQGLCSSMPCMRRTAGVAATPTSACSRGVFVTALYTFRMFFMTFHGEERHGP